MNKTIFYIVLLLFTGIFTLVFAAGPPPPPPSGGPPCWPPPCSIPIDGGVGFLIAAGIGYGIKKIHQYLNKAE